MKSTTPYITHSKVICGTINPVDFKYVDIGTGKTIALTCELDYKKQDGLDRKYEWVFSQSELFGFASVLLGLKSAFGSSTLVSNANDDFFARVMRFHCEEGEVRINYCVIPAENEQALEQSFLVSNFTEGAFPGSSHIRTFNLEDSIGGISFSTNEQSLLAMFAVRRLAESWGVSVLDILALLPMSNTKPVMTDYTPRT